ncbi:MAG: GNAT family N-acetyltransferase [Acidimicrobiales bacterium]
MTGDEIHRATGSTISARELYAALELRGAVFVVEQECPYLDPDGRDLEPSTRHLWLDAADGGMAAYLRVLDDGDGTLRIGRVVTAPSSRRTGLATRLLVAALDEATDAVVLDAQSQHTALYERHGFVVDGEEHLEDGIPHTPMRRPAPR